ncbi:unnamed protein product [Leuciscus chuanchicus]
MAVTTIQHYVLNVGCFMRFLSETPPQSCRLSRKALVGLRREMGSLRKSLKRGLAVHQTAVKEGKETNILAKATLLRCRELAAKAIPELLDLLEKEPSLKNLWRFYGHFAALLSCIYGHRGGVFQNITIQEVVGARKSSSERVHLINHGEEEASEKGSQDEQEPQEPSTPPQKVPCTERQGDGAADSIEVAGLEPEACVTTEGQKGHLLREFHDARWDQPPKEGRRKGALSNKLQVGTGRLKLMQEARMVSCFCCVFRCRGKLERLTECDVTEKVQIRLPGWERLEILVAETGSYDWNMGSFDGEGQGLLQMFLGEALRRGGGSREVG